MLNIVNLTKIYTISRRVAIRAADNISVELPNQGFVAIVGKSGSGKTTLLNLIGNLEKPTAGKIWWGDDEKNKFCISELTKHEADRFRNLSLGFVFQNYNLMEHWTVEQNVRITLEQQEWEEKSPEDIAERVANALELVDLKGYEKRKIYELSGGQQQRVAIARAIVKAPKLLLADEPTGNLDTASSQKILEVLKKISEACLVIMVTHDQLSAEQYADRIICMSDGKIAEDRNLYQDGTANETEEKKWPAGREGTRECRLNSATVFRLNLSALRIKKLKLFFSMLILITVLGILHVAYTLYGISCGPAISHFLKKYAIDTLYFYENAEHELNGYTDSIELRNGEELVSILKNTFGEENVYSVLEECNVSADSEQKENLCSCKLIVGGEIPGSCEFVGNMPAAGNELAITDAIAENIGVTGNIIGNTIFVDGNPMVITGYVNLRLSEDGPYSQYEEYEIEKLADRIMVSADYYEYLRTRNSILLPFADINFNQSFYEISDTAVELKRASSSDGTLIWGRYPEKQGEIVLGSDYAENRLFPMDEKKFDGWEADFLKLSDSGEENPFSSYISLGEIIPAVTVVGIEEGYDGIILSDIDYELVINTFCDNRVSDSVEVVLNKKTREDSRIYSTLYQKGYIAEMALLEYVYSEYEDYIHFRLIYRVIMYVMIFLAFLLFVLFFSFNVKDNYHQIGILRSLGTRNSDIARIWLSESAAVTALALVLSGIVENVIIGERNKSYRIRMELVTNIIYHDIWRELLFSAALFGLTAVTVLLPIWFLHDKKLIDLIRTPE